MTDKLTDSEINENKYNEIAFIDFLFVDSNKEDQIFSYTKKPQFLFDLEATINYAVKERLGANFNVKKITYSDGTIDIKIIIEASIGVYYFISHYNDFTESITILVTHIKQIINHFFKPKELSGEWSPSPFLLNIRKGS